jgi:hypothetical protein
MKPNPSPIIERPDESYGRRIAITFATALALSACGFDSIGDSFDCETNDDCDEFRRCVDGLCLVAGTTCHPDCDSCTDGICRMDCRENGACPNTVVCPPSRTCEVLCNAGDSCRGGVDCTHANRCVVLCQGVNSCAGLIDCGTSDCNVRCDGGPGACAGGVDCTDACACDTACEANNGERTCLPDCPSGCDNGSDCVSDGCDFCE